MKVIPETRRGTNIDIYVSSTIEILWNILFESN